MIRTVLLSAGLLFLAGSGFAQSYNAFSGRNHPELDWQVAETEHFRIMYPARLAGIEEQAAPIAEASYAALAANLGVTFDDKIRIYLSDEDAILNGFAVPIGDGYTQIWVHQNEGARTWTGPEKWLRKVLAHELAHIFHYRAVRSSLGPGAALFGNPLPRFWTEGLAQYTTETWDAQRGDRWLRTAVLDDQLSYTDGRSIWNGRLLYAVGNSQVRYFAWQHGDSTLANLLAHRTPVLGGLFRIHDFNEAIEATTGQSYRDFYDDWRRTVNIYYNTLAGQMEALDSLGTASLRLPGQYLYDVQAGPDTSRLAAVLLPSLSRPVRRLVLVDRTGDTGPRILADGGIQTPVAWHPDGTQIAFGRTTRGRFGAIITDLYVVDIDGGGPRRLTEDRRAQLPSYSPDGTRLAFVATDGGTSNVFVLDLATGLETQATRFEGDVQIESIAWHPSAERLAVARFQADGTRDLALVDVATGRTTPLTDGLYDDRGPVWSPDGQYLAYTSLRDDIPNVLVLDPETRRTRRVTFLAVGASVHDWLPADSAHAAGRLLVIASARKSSDEAYLVDAARTAPASDPRVPPGYGAWTRHRPPAEVPPDVLADASLIQDRYAYRPWRNLTHIASLGWPYYQNSGDWGLTGFTSWLEPLAKHQLYLAGTVSFPSFLDDSYVLASYVNNQLRPTLIFSGYRITNDGRIYGNDLLVDQLFGGDVRVQWPLDWSDVPYVEEAVSARLRYVDIDPLNPEDFDSLNGLFPPEAGQQADLQLRYLRRKQRPYRYNNVHPLDAYGLRLQVTGAAPVLGADRSFLRGDVSAWTLVPTLGLQRLFLYGRAQAQTGTSFAQDYLGLSRYDDIQLWSPTNAPVDIRLGDAERVRGYRSYALGNRVLFGTVEYRLQLLTDLRTEVLGLVRFGGTALGLFADGAFVWTDAAFDERVERLGVGAELKNAFEVLGAFQFGHAIGIAQPAADLGAADYDLYYRVRAAVPF